MLPFVCHYNVGFGSMTERYERHDGTRSLVYENVCYVLSKCL